MPNANYLLLVEDDQRLLRSTRLLAEDVGWETLTACSIQEAEEIAESKTSGIRVALIDMMIPANRVDRGKLEVQVKLRQMTMNEYRRRQRVNEFDEEKLLEIRDEIQLIDAVIRKLVTLDGGQQFLLKAYEKRWSEEWKVAVFSATAPPSTIKSMDYGVPTTNWLGWWQKPLGDDWLTETLSGLLARRL